MAPRVFAFSLLVSSTVALVAACSADGGGDELLTDDEAGATEPAPTSKLPPSTVPDAALDDAGKDAAKDAAKDAKDSAADADAGTPAPTPGSACKTIDEFFKRSCGICGTQEALCLAKPDGTPGIVSDYSPCANELASGCLPGTIENEPCGNCGTRKRTCNQYCAWTTSACTGEPVSSCTPTTQDYTSAGCPMPNTVRTRSCGATCSWTNFTPTCGPLEHKLVAAAAAGGTISAIYPLRAAVADKRMTGTCPNGYFSSTTTHPYAYVQIVNPTASTLTLSAWNTIAQAGGPIIDTVMAWYAGSAKPSDETARKACTKGVIDSCPTGLPCGDYKWAGLTGTSAITLPPMGSAMIFFGSYYAAGSGTLAEGPVQVVVRTDTVN